MLRWFPILILILSLGMTAQAQSLEFETLRTKTHPGFFALRIFPGNDLTPIPVQNIYVDNTNHKKFTPLKQALSELGAQVINPDQATKYLYRADYRVIWLGLDAPVGSVPFMPVTENILSDFESFSETQLGPVYLQNLTFNFGGNVSEVYPASIAHLGSQATIYGKFERPIKTRLELRGTMLDGEIMAHTPLYLDQYHEIDGVRTLAEDWEAAYELANAKSSPIFYDEDWLNLFPWLLFLGGIGLIILASFQIFRHSHTTLQPLPTGKTIDKDWWKQPIEETSLYKEWEENVPFEVVEKES